MRGIEWLKSSKKSTVLKSGGFAYTLGRKTKSGYGTNRVQSNQALGTQFHDEIVTLVLHRTPRGFLRLTRKLSWRFFYKGLHFFFAKNFLTRSLNFLLYLRERHRTSQVHYMPPLIFLDPSSKCSLRCPGCATGLGLARKRTTASLHMMKAVVDQVSTTAVQIAFYHLGEAFFNDDVFEALRYARMKGLWTVVSSHLSINRPGLPERIVESGLHDLIISCDGASQPIYEQYRKGGNIDLVLANLRKMRAHRDRLNRKTPFLRTKMIVFEHNWHEAKCFEQRAREHGADEVQFVFGNGDETFDNHIIASGAQFDIADLSWKEKVPTGPCKEIWQSMYITPDGGIFSCCLGYRDQDLFVSPGADLNIRRMWNAPSYVAARKYFLGQNAAHQTPTVCQTCLYVTNFSAFEKS